MLLRWDSLINDATWVSGMSFLLAPLKKLPRVIEATGSDVWHWASASASAVRPFIFQQFILNLINFAQLDIVRKELTSSFVSIRFGALPYLKQAHVADYFAFFFLFFFFFSQIEAEAIRGMWLIGERKPGEPCVWLFFNANKSECFRNSSSINVDILNDLFRNCVWVGGTESIGGANKLHAFALLLLSI